MIAKRTVILGHHGEIHAGDKIPVSFTDGLGNVQATDWERLVEIDVIDAIPEPGPEPKRRGRPPKVKTEPQPDDDSTELDTEADDPVGANPVDEGEGSGDAPQGRR